MNQNSFEKIFELLQNSNIAVLKNELMSKHTTFKIGGPAKLFVTVNTLQELKLVLKTLDENKAEYFILGNGSNILVSDEGIDKAVIELSGEFKSICLCENKIICGSAVSLAKLCSFALENSLSGLEFAYGIPGTVGGAAYMNAGAYGGEMKDVLVLAEHITQNGEEGFLEGDDLKLSYRHSAYKESNSIISCLHFNLKAGKKSEIKTKMNDFMQRRTDKQPLEYPSAGSTFKRPQGSFAGSLIEQCELKGYSVGGAQVSDKHAGFIINTGNATCSDVLNLIEYIQKTVKEKTGYTLEPEIIKI